jgi:hypothetical protein
LSYIGQVWKSKPLHDDLDFNRTAIVLVTGDGANLCGHVLLYIGGGFGHYYQFSGPALVDYPTYMNQADYERYLRENKKEELMRRWVTIPKPNGAAKRLSELLNGEWLTLVVSHNCTGFVSEVLNAGGNFYSLPSHCPVPEMGSFEFWEKIFGPIRRKIGTENAYMSHQLR